MLQLYLFSEKTMDIDKYRDYKYFIKFYVIIDEGLIDILELHEI